ncbi:hypothetical protein [Agrococcus baldri]|uniref:Uncharacterized protein n=1 Tax=Agrococcus baldri TaxID=153730 RepID=A0AA87RIX3_9MICO|nr:hypothetical protein [Agrococcus baldri]GEK80208.1 hypothetical protein ABA31_15590 [Agrococcus baldri]
MTGPESAARPPSEREPGATAAHDLAAGAAVQRAAERAPTALRRWPSLAGLLLGAAMAAALFLTAGGRVEFGAAETAQVLVAAGLVYLGAAAFGIPWSAWVLFAITVVLIAVGIVEPGFDPLRIMLALAIVLAVWGLARGRARPRWGLPLTTAAMLLIVALALGGGLLPQPWAGILVGVGLLAHAAWDWHHHRTRRVVSGSLAELCMVLDTVLGLGIIAFSLLG